MHPDRRRALAALCSAPLAFVRPAQASGWPTQPLKMSIGYSTGGAADMVARAIATGVQRTLGQPLVMEYRPGAGGAIAAGAVARAPADGYTLYLADTGSMAIIPNLRKVPYDPVQDFTPLSWVGGASLVLVVNPQVPAHDVPALVRLLQQNPEGYAYSSSGIGSPHHLAAELFKQMTQTQARHIAYKGAAPALNDLMGGQVQMGFSTIAPALPLIEAGRLRAIAVSGARRSPSLPQVPTIAEQGVAGYEAMPWFAVVGPPGLPADIAARLQAAFAAALTDKEVVAALEKLGTEAVSPRTPAYVTQAIRDDLAKWGRVIRTANIQLEG